LKSTLGERMDAIVLKKLTKKYLTAKKEELIAVNSISFNIKEGEIFGFLGPNGAGKTTTLSMLSTITEPTSGEAKVNGFDIKTQQSEVRRSIGIVFQDPSLDDELTALENMDFHGRLYGLSKKKRIQKGVELLKLVGLDDRKDDLVKTFSGGMKRRLEIARGLLHEPKILFLDEPTIGLDPQTRNHIWNYISKLSKESNMTMLLTTHYLDEADKLCDRIAIIDMGKIVAIGTPNELKESLGGDVITVETPQASKLSKCISKHSWVKSVKIHDHSITISAKNAEKHIAELVKTCASGEVTISSISVHKPSLDDVFLHFTGKTIREQEAEGTLGIMRAMARSH